MNLLALAALVGSVSMAVWFMHRGILWGINMMHYQENKRRFTNATAIAHWKRRSGLALVKCYAYHLFSLLSAGVAGQMTLLVMG